MPCKVSMPTVGFTQRDWDTMVREGWAVFNLGEVRQQIERDDERNLFATDDDAVAFVARRALRGSTLHVKALVLHLQGVTARCDHFSAECDALKEADAVREELYQKCRKDRDETSVMLAQAAKTRDATPSGCPTSRMCRSRCANGSTSRRPLGSATRCARTSDP